MLDSQKHSTLHSHTPAATATVCGRERARGLLRRAAAQGRDLEAPATPLEGADWLTADGTRAESRRPAAVRAAAEGSGSEGAVDVGAASSCAHWVGGGGRGQRAIAVRQFLQPQR